MKKMDSNAYDKRLVNSYMEPDSELHAEIAFQVYGEQNQEKEMRFGTFDGHDFQTTALDFPLLPEDPNYVVVRASDLAPNKRYLYFRIGRPTVLAYERVNGMIQEIPYV